MQSCSERSERESDSSGASFVTRSPGYASAARRPARLAEAASQLSRTIETEIIPRLMMAMGDETPEATGAPMPARHPSAAELETFVDLVVERDASTALAFAEGLAAAGVSRQSIYLDLLAPAARTLGCWWEEDRCGFTAVTVGLGRLQQVLQACSSSLRGSRLRIRAPGPRVLFAPAPGEQHTFGLVMVADFFRQAGWDVATASTSAETCALVRARPFELLGLSISAERHLDRLQLFLSELRQAPRNPGLRFLLGGSLIAQRPELVAGLGADLLASDGVDAVAAAGRLVSGSG